MNSNKYAGCTPGPWLNAGAAVLSSSGEHVALCKTKDAPLLADAPLLLAQRDRLAEALREYVVADGADIELNPRKRAAISALAEYEKESVK